jgi:hypothetical protein
MLRRSSLLRSWSPARFYATSGAAIARVTFHNADRKGLGLDCFSALHRPCSRLVVPPVRTVDAAAGSTLLEAAWAAQVSAQSPHTPPFHLPAD